MIEVLSLPHYITDLAFLYLGQSTLGEILRVAFLTLP